MPELKDYSFNKLEKLFERIYESQEDQLEILRKIKLKEEIMEISIHLYDELLQECIFEEHLRNILKNVIIPNKKDLPTTDQDN